MLKCFGAAAKALAAKHKKPILVKKILIPQSDQEDSTQDSVIEGTANVRLCLLVVIIIYLLTVIITARTNVIWLKAESLWQVHAPARLYLPGGNIGFDSQIFSSPGARDPYLSLCIIGPHNYTYQNCV